MTVRIAQDLGLDKIIKYSKKLSIYENPEELLSISLGSAETTLLQLTSAYSVFVNGGKLVEPVLIDRIQDSEGNTIYNNDKRSCVNCDAISYLSDDYPELKNKYIQIFSEETAYQMTSILEGVVQRGTAKKLRDLKLNIAGKTGTTNNNTDTWFIGFTSNLVIGVYIGYDEPKTLGKYETGAKTAMPVFKEFVQNAVNKENARPFKVSKNIKMMVVDAKTGQKANYGTTDTIIEVFKSNKLKNSFDENNNLDGIKSLYGYSKITSEMLIEEYSYAFNLDYLIIRSGLITGPWQFGKVEQGLISLWIIKHIFRQKLSYIGFNGTGKQIRDVLFIEDFCEFILISIKKFKSVRNKTFCIGGGKKNKINLKELTNYCQKITKNKIKINKIKKTSNYDIPYFVAKNQKAMNFLKWRPKTNIRDTIIKTYNWINLNKKLIKKYYNE